MSVTSHYLCPDCDHEWSDTWSCACNSQCPACGIKDIEPVHEVTLDRAFDLVLRAARAKHDHDFRHALGGIGAELDELKEAIDLVTGYHFLFVKGR